MQACKASLAALLLMAVIGMVTLTGCGTDKNKDGKDDTLMSSSTSTTTTTTTGTMLPSTSANGTV